MPDTLTATAKALNLDRYEKHIFLCATPTEAKCCAHDEGMASWQFLKKRLNELKLCGPQALLHRSKADCLRPRAYCCDLPRSYLVSFLHS